LAETTIKNQPVDGKIGGGNVGLGRSGTMSDEQEPKRSISRLSRDDSGRWLIYFTDGSTIDPGFDGNPWVGLETLFGCEKCDKEESDVGSAKGES
jgi:hypothetical protein